MKTEISYKGLDRKRADEKAIQDIAGYLGDERVALFGDLVAYATCIEHEIEMLGQDGKPHKQTMQGLNMTFGFAGISGYPFHAFCRRYCLSAYRTWMASSSDGQPVETDEEGFALPVEEPGR